MKILETQGSNLLPDLLKLSGPRLDGGGVKMDFDGLNTICTRGNRVR